MAAGAEVLKICVGAGGSLTGEHGVGLEKKEQMPLVFTGDGTIVSGGNFHAEPVALAADQIALAIAEIAEDAARLILPYWRSNTAVETKSDDSPVTQADRAAVLAALESVDAVFIFDDLRATNFLQIAQPDVYVKGGDYTVDQLPAEERAIIETQGGRITVLGHLPGKSSTEIARRILEG